MIGVNDRAPIYVIRTSILEMIKIPNRLYLRLNDI